MTVREMQKCIHRKIGQIQKLEQELRVLRFMKERSEKKAAKEVATP